MSFKIRSTDSKKIQLISLMDCVFILLLFFLVSIFFASLPNEERKLFVPTPKNEPGNAQVLIQLIDDQSFFYIDPFMTEQLVRDITAIDNRGSNAGARLRAKKDMITRNNTFQMTNSDGSVNNLQTKIENLVQHANSHPEEKYFAIIRCPDDISYASVIDVIQLLSGTKYGNIQYGCVGGTIDDIRNSRRIERQNVREEGAIRRNVVIQF